MRRLLSRAALPLFLTLVIGVSAALNILIVQVGGVRHAGGLIVAMMCLPGVAAILTLAITRWSLRGIGWDLPRPAYLLAAVVLPALITVPVYAGVWLSGLADLKVTEWSRLVQQNFGFEVAPFAALGVIFSLGLLVNSLVAAGEEIGWRGFLFPELNRSMAAPAAALLTGAIWAAWHYPGLLFAGYANAETPAWFNLISFTAMVLGWSMVLGWIRLASGSIWPAALMHGAHNLVVQAVLDSATDGKGATQWLTGEFGAGVAAAYLLAGAFAWRALRRRTERDAGESAAGAVSSSATSSMRSSARTR